MDEDALTREIAALRNALTWMDSVMANLNDGVFVVNDKWKLTFANTALAELVDNMRITMLGKPAWDVVQISQNNAHLDTKIRASKLTIKDVVKLNGIYRLNSSKTIRIIELRCTYIPNVNQAVCVLTDVTLETKAMEKLHDHHKESTLPDGSRL